ncbi:MAG: helix-turn-helix transcriptional regulator [Pseudomonadota bacterium]
MRNATHNMDEQIGRRVKTVRLQSPHSIEQLSAMTGVTVAQCQSIESGETRANAAFLARVANVLDVEIRQFFDEYCNLQQIAAVELIKTGKSRPAFADLIRASKQKRGGLRAA